MREKTRLRAGLSSAAALTLLLAACGADDDDGGDGGEETTAEATDTESEAPESDATDEEAAAAEGSEEDGYPYFEGETIRVVVPTNPGGANDLAGRAVGDFLARELGASLEVENLTGGGGMRGGNEFARMEPDGYSFYMMGSTPLSGWLFGQDGIEFDMAEFEPVWGSPISYVHFGRTEAGLETYEDVFNADGPIYVGAENVPNLLTGLLCYESLGLTSNVDGPIEMVFGYDGNPAIAAGMEAGELDLDSRPIGTWLSQHSTQIESGEQTGLWVGGLVRDGELIRDPQLPDLPTQEEAYMEVNGEAPSGETWEACYAMTEILTGAGFGFYTHGDAPQEARDQVHRAIEAIQDDPEFRDLIDAAVGAGDPMIGEDLLQWHDTLVNFDQDVLDFIQNDFEPAWEART